MRHALSQARDPERVVVLGAGGFIGSALVALLERRGVPVLPLGSCDLDLAAPDAGARLSGLLRETDSLVFLSALTPDKGRDVGTFMRNMAMGQAVSAALSASPVAHVVYASSDAVYPFAAGRITEASRDAPSDLYGTMHRAREVMLAAASSSAPLAILRVTMVYGAGDTHNSYGPNRFRRMAAAEGRIALGGAGEETRDHVLVDDVAALFLEVLRHRSAGILNCASGRSVSFDALARKVAALAGRPVEVVHTPRTAPVTHRHFDVTELRKAFPRFRFIPLDEGLGRAWREAAGEGA
jgi:nucleoside-diphosphate-sugar epimerase